MAEDKEIKQEVTIVDENDVPPFVRAKIQKDLQQQELMNQSTQAEYEKVLAEGNVDKAIELLIDLIFSDDNTPERREKLRELYSSQCQSGDAVEYGYLQVMEVRGGATGNNPINNAKTDYIEYLKLQAQKYDYSKYVDECAIALARKIAGLSLEVLNDSKGIKKSSKGSDKSKDSSETTEVKFVDENDLPPSVRAKLKGDSKSSVKIGLPKTITVSDTEIIKWLIRGQEYERALEYFQSAEKKSDLVQVALENLQIECTRFQNNGETEKIEYQQATWCMANIFEKHGDKRQAIQKYIECKDYKNSYNSAYDLVDLHDTEAIRFVLDLFQKHNVTAYVEISNVLLNRHNVVEDMFTVKPMPSNMTAKYFFLSIMYAFYRVKSEFGMKSAILIFLGLPIVSTFIASVTSIYLPIIVIMGLVEVPLIRDIFKYKQFTESHIMYKYLTSKLRHHQLFSLSNKYTGSLSGEKGTVKRLIFLALYVIALYAIALYNIPSPSENKQATVTVTSDPVVEQSIKSDNIFKDSKPDIQTTTNPTITKTLGENWIKDDHTEIYLWNPNPKGDEQISWNGGFVQDGDYKFADGSGTLTWYRDGEVIQVDEGTFEHGRHQGRFKHTFKSGNVAYSNWEHGEEIQDTNDNQSSDSRGQFVGTYNSGMKAYIVPGSLKISSDRKSCNVKIVAEGNVGDIAYLDYHIWREGSTLKFSNSEGYSGVVTSDMRVENKIWEIAQSLNR